MTQSNQRCVADVSINALVACNAHDNSITFTKFLCERPSGNGKTGLCLNVQHSNWMRSQPLAERRSAFTDLTDATRSLEDSANLPSALPSRVPSFPRHTKSIGPSRHTAGGRTLLDPCNI